MLRASPYALPAGALLAGTVVAASALRGLMWIPAPVEPAAVQCPATTPHARAGDPLRVLIWNVQYAGSTRHHFFYDGGQAVHVPEADVRWTLDQLVQVVQDIDPDVILWQELDRGSDRIQGIDMVAELAPRLDYPCRVQTPYHQVAYVPTPDHEHMGKVSMHLGVWSRVALGEATRHQLALLDEPWWRQAFNLRRAALVVDVPVDGGPDLTLVDTHLSAFSRGDGTLPRQLRQIERLATDAVQHGHGVLLAGDLNSLPPGEDGSRLTAKDQALYSDGGDPLASLYEHLTPSVPLDRLQAAPGAYFTYVPFGGRPDRTIDHVFVGGGVAVRSHKVRQDRLDISDHLPIVLEIDLPAGEAP